MVPIFKKYVEERFKKVCQRKQIYLTREDAQIVFMILQHRSEIFDFTLRVYKCPFKNHFHLGHPSKKAVFERLPKIVENTYQ